MLHSVKEFQEGGGGRSFLPSKNLRVSAADMLLSRVDCVVAEVTSG